MLKGTAASAGIGIGRAVLIREKEIEVARRAVPFVQEEKQRFQDAVTVFISELEQAKDMVERNVGVSEAAILGAQIAIIQDPELTKEVLRSIERQQVNVEYVFNSICNGYITLFSSLEDELLAARAADFRDIRGRMLRILMGIRKPDLATVPPGSVLVAEELVPSQAALIDPARVLGIVTQAGTRFSHIAIITRALQLPAVMGVGGLLDRVREGDTLVVDGNAGEVCVSPAPALLEQYRRRQQAAAEQRAALERYRDTPTETTDGCRVRLTANLAMLPELEQIVQSRADGVGLLRTEFLYMERQHPPEEQEQFEAYKQVVQALEGRPVHIRTLDIGGDKDIPWLPGGAEENPFFGLRAVRFCLAHPVLFKTQLAAILRAAVFGDIRIMVPMITCVTELRAVRALLQEVCRDLRARGVAFREQVPLGIMVETPAAALCAAELAAEADFFSIGTNDLTQHTLVADRSNERLAQYYNTLHPAVLRLITMTVQAALHAGIPVGVCGEAAADPLLIPFLIGAGVEELSVSAGALLAVRRRVNEVSRRQWAEYLPAVLALPTPEEVAAFIQEHAPDTQP